MDKREAFRLVFNRENRLFKLRKLCAPKKILDNEERLFNLAKERLYGFGATWADYENFRAYYGVVFELEQAEYEIEDDCLINLIALQNNRYQCPHVEENHKPDGRVPCGPLCSFYKKASDKQNSDFANRIDIITGESLPEV